MLKQGSTGWISEAMWVALGLGISMLALLAGTRLLTTLLPADEFGKLSLAVSLATLAVQVGATPISLAVLRFYAPWKETGKLHGLLHCAGRSLAGVLAIVIVLTLAVAAMAQYRYLGIRLPLVVISGVLTLLLVLNRIALAFEDAARERRARAVFQVAFEVGRFGLAVLLLMFAGQKRSEIALMGFILAASGVIVLQFYFLRAMLAKQDPLQKKPDADQIDKDKKAFQRFFLPLIISNGCAWIVLMGERWSLQFLGSLSDVGGYTAIHQLSFMPMVAISNFLLILSAPILYGHIGVAQQSEKSSRALQVNRLFSFILIFCTLLVSFVFYRFNSAAGALLVGEEFRKYSWVFPWLFLAGGFFAASQQLLLKLTSEFQTRILALLWLGIALFAIAAYVTCTHYWKLHGLVGAVVGVNLALLIFSLALSVRAGRVNDGAD